jgi:hypothetical protein
VSATSGLKDHVCLLQGSSTACTALRRDFAMREALVLSGMLSAVLSVACMSQER